MSIRKSFGPVGRIARIDLKEPFAIKTPGEAFVSPANAKHIGADAETAISVPCAPDLFMYGIEIIKAREKRACDQFGASSRFDPPPALAAPFLAIEQSDSDGGGMLGPIADAEARRRRGGVTGDPCPCERA